MLPILQPFLAWYVVIQLVGLAALPLAWRIFTHLPDRGAAFSKPLGILLLGFLLWWGTSYGLLRNSAGGAWLALLLLAGVSWGLGWRTVRTAFQERRLPVRGGWRTLLAVEALFLLAFLGWTLVRAYDPAINHTEQPMDLMFMSSIWTSPTYPPQDAWLAGYAISYYYLGYWLLVTLARLAGQLPQVAYNLGQACWFGLLLTTSFGLGFNLLAGDPGKEPKAAQANPPRSAYTGGLLSALAVGLMGNLQGILEWLHAQGVDVSGLARLVDVRGFPEQAPVTGEWFIDRGWWWWRSSRVLRDTDLLGNHMEVIDEFPFFSYLLGDNHPHVLAMPFVLLVLALLLNLFRGLRSPAVSGGKGATASPRWAWIAPLQGLATRLPGGILGTAVLLLALGGLVTVNTWDFPPYWLLLALVLLVVGARHTGLGRPLLAWAGGVALLVLAATVAVYFPYFLTAQSQAQGFLPNLFNPTHLPQFLLMFGHFLLGTGVLFALAWREAAPSPARLAVSLGLSLGLPLAFLAVTAFLALNTALGREAIERMTLPPETPGYAQAILGRWLARPWTLLLVGILVGLAGALVWQRLAVTDEPATGERPSDDTTFVLLLAGLGLLLVYTPEFVYLRDFFGTRMNTVFKFYYQGWLLLALSSSYALVLGLRQLTRLRPASLVSGAALLLSLATLIYPVAGVYSKTGGFVSPAPTLDGLAYVGDDERAAMAWIREHVPPGAVVLEGKGASYRADRSRFSAATGRPTLLGWDGHESQWRGKAYSQMAQGRPEALETIYRTGSPVEIAAALERWGIEFVVVGPAERADYELTPQAEARLAQVMTLAFEQGGVRIYQRRGPVSVPSLAQKPGVP